MYSPFSVNAFGRARLLDEIFEDENYDLIKTCLETLWLIGVFSGRA